MIKSENFLVLIVGSSLLTNTQLQSMKKFIQNLRHYLIQFRITMSVPRLWITMKKVGSFFVTFVSKVFHTKHLYPSTTNQLIWVKDIPVQHAAMKLKRKGTF